MLLVLKDGCDDEPQGRSAFEGQPEKYHTQIQAPLPAITVTMLSLSIAMFVLP